MVFPKMVILNIGFLTIPSFEEYKSINRNIQKWNMTKEAKGSYYVKIEKGKATIPFKFQNFKEM